jgi:hypothetical protein
MRTVGRLLLRTDGRRKRIQTVMTHANSGKYCRLAIFPWQQTLLPHTRRTSSTRLLSVSLNPYAVLDSPFSCNYDSLIGDTIVAVYL